MEFTRRQFLGIMGATAAGLGLTKSIQNRVLAATGASSDTWYDRVETRVKSVCELCPGGCGFDVRVINGMPVKIDGNPLHPVNRGGTGSWDQYGRAGKGWANSRPSPGMKD